MLDETITNASLESTREIGSVDGLGLLPVIAAFEAEKRFERVSVSVDGTGPIDGASGIAEGYEIHMGTTSLADEVQDEGSITRSLGERSVATDRVLGTYLAEFMERSIRYPLVFRQPSAEHLFS